MLVRSIRSCSCRCCCHTTSWMRWTSGGYVAWPEWRLAAQLIDDLIRFSLYICARANDSTCASDTFADKLFELVQQQQTVLLGAIRICFRVDIGEQSCTFYLRNLFISMCCGIFSCQQLITSYRFSWKTIQRWRSTFSKKLTFTVVARFLAVVLLSNRTAVRYLTKTAKF